MSTENNSSNENPQQNSSPEEERKKQFEKMKDRFGKKPSNPFLGFIKGVCF